METIKKMKNYWIGMFIMPFIIIAGMAIYEGDIDEIFTDEYLFSEMGLVFIGITLLAIIGSYLFQIIKEGVKKDVSEIRNYLEERRVATTK